MVPPGLDGGRVGGRHGGYRGRRGGGRGGYHDRRGGGYRGGRDYRGRGEGRGRLEKDEDRVAVKKEDGEKVKVWEEKGAKGANAKEDILNTQEFPPLKDLQGKWYIDVCSL